MKEKAIISISLGTFINFFLVLGISLALYYNSDFVVTLLVAVVLASAVELPIKKMMSWGLSRAVSLGIVLSSSVLIIALVGITFIPPIAEDVARFISTLPALLSSLQVFGVDLGLKTISTELQNLIGTISKDQILDIIKNSLFGVKGFYATTSAVVSALITCVLILVLAFYLALEDRGVHKFLKLLTPVDKEKYVEDLWDRSQRKIGYWMKGQLILCSIVSVLIYIPMLILGMPYALLLAIFAFIGELIPVVGLTIAMIPTLLIAFAHGGVSLLGIVFVIYIIVAQVEGNILYPKVMNRLVGVPSVIILIAVVIGAKLAGLWGVLLSVPIAAILMELASDIEKRKEATKEIVAA